MQSRRSTRLYSHHYAWKGWYFVTIKTKDNEPVFGDINNGSMILNDFGHIAKEEWINTEIIRTNIKIDEFVIMPDHIHGLINIKFEINSQINSKSVLQYAPTITSSQHACSYDRSTIQICDFKSPSNTLGAVIRGYKGTVTKKINIIRNTLERPVWQRNYYDRIIRNFEELELVRKYIRNNPRSWDNNGHQNSFDPW